jgi:condensin complex subunit 1
VSPEAFKRITAYLIAFIVKEKHIESLVEKLCHRFQASEDIVHLRGLAHCLSLLNFTNDRCVTKLIGLLKFYGPHLVDDAIFQSISGIINKAKKTNSAEVRVAIDEFEIQVNALHNCEDPDQALAKSKTEVDREEEDSTPTAETLVKKDDPAKPKTRAAPARKTKAKADRKPKAPARKSRRKIESSSESSADEMEMSSESEAASDEE